MGREIVLLLFTWAAGSVDAINCLGLGHVFTTMMTGNAVSQDLAIGQGHVLAVVRSVLALNGFDTSRCRGSRGRECKAPSAALVLRRYVRPLGALRSWESHYACDVRGPVFV